MLVVFPYSARDQDQAVRLAEWIRELGQNKSHCVLIVRDRRCDLEHDKAILAALTETFAAVETLTVNDDAYDSWPESANTMFRNAAKHIEFTKKEPFLWLEPDVAPLKEGWLDAIAVAYVEAVAAGKPFMGDRVEVENVPLHMSGVACYPGIMSNFAGLAYLAQDIAWDCAAAAQIVPQAHFTNLIEHAWKHPTFESWEHVEREIAPETVLYHASKDGSLLRLLRERRDQERSRLPNGSNDGPCSVEGCSNPAYAKTVCKMHYARKERNGHFGLQVRPSVHDMLETNRVVDEKGCWLWTGSQNSNGYGQIYLEGVKGPRGVHRVAYEHYVDPIPDEMCVCHRCDVRLCFNPAHLFLGTDLDNMRDAANKGRLPHGESHQWAKLTDAQVHAIRSKYAEGEVDQYSLADEYGCSQSNISMIVSGVTRREVTTAIICDIFIKTYPPDYPWLEYCLRSIDKFALNFETVVIVDPKRPSDKPDFPDSGGRFGGPQPLKIVLHKPEYGADGYLSQQVFKLYSDTLTEADFILFTDSDTIFTCSVTPETYFTDGRVNWMITPYAKTDTPWKPMIEKFLGRPVEFETMRRHPQMVPRWLLIAMREFCEKQHGVPLDKYVMSQPYREFSEFNALGAFAFYFHNDRFNWINTATRPEQFWPELTVLQKYSHGGLTPEIVAEFEAILSGDVSTVVSAGCESKSLEVAKGRTSDPTPCEDSAPPAQTLSATNANGAPLLATLPQQVPWESKEQSLEEIRSLAARLREFCGQAAKVRAVRLELHKLGVIELPYRFRKRKGKWKRKVKK